MSLLRRLDALEPFYSPPFFSFSSSESSSSFSSSIFAPQTLTHPPLLHEAEKTFCALEHITHCPYLYHPIPLELFDAVTDLIPTPPPPPRSLRPCKRTYRRFADHGPCVDLFCDQFDRLAIGRGGGTGDRKYKWTAEIEGKYVDRRYKCTTEIKEKEREKGKLHHRPHYHHHPHHVYDCYYYCDKGKEERTYKWTAEIKEKGLDGPVKRTYTWQTTIGGEEGKEKGSNRKNKKKKEEHRLVENAEPNHRAVILRQVCVNYFMVQLKSFCINF